MSLMMQPAMVDLCSGFGGASAAMVDAGWNVVRVDIDEKVKPDIVADVHRLPLRLNERPLLVWASPTCTEYSRWGMPASWFPDRTYPSLDLWWACKRGIRYLDPVYWVVENVRGAQLFHGRADFHFGPYFLWTNIPLISPLGHEWPSKAKMSRGSHPLASAKRGRLPYGISLAVREACLSAWENERYGQ